jgi:hypothetical protein
MAASKITQKKNLKKSSPKALAMSTLAGLLAACNSDSDSSSVITTPIVTSTALSGAVVKGPLSGALVYADNDGDGIGDGDPITTASDGSYTITATNANATIIAMSGPNTIDTASGEALSGITLKAPAGSTVVTPATTILESQPNIEPAQLAIALGIPTTAADGSAIDLMSFNPYAAGADPAAALAAEKAAQQVMVTIKAVSAAAEGAGMSVDNAFAQAMASVAEVVSVEAEKIDVSSTAAIEAAEASIASGDTVKIDFSDSTVLDAVSTAVQTKVVAAAAADDTISVDTTAFAAVLETAVTAVVNVNAAIEAITDTDLTSTESMGTFATLTDIASEIKAAAVAEVATPGSGAALVTFTDATAVNAAAAAASTVLVEAEAAEVAAAAAIAAADAAAATAAAAAAAAETDSASEAAPAAPAAPAEFDTEQFFVVNSVSGASWNGKSSGTQDLTVAMGTSTLDISSDVQVTATDFTSAFSNSAADTGDTAIGSLSITNLTTPISGSQTNREVTVTITESTLGSKVEGSKIVAGFDMDWSLSGSNYLVGTDDTSLDVTYSNNTNTSVTVAIPNPSLNFITIAPDNAYGGSSTLSINALSLITKLEATGIYQFADLETRFAQAGTTLEVSVDVSNLNIYNAIGSSTVSHITSTIDII